MSTRRLLTLLRVLSASLVAVGLYVVLPLDGGGAVLIAVIAVVGLTALLLPLAVARARRILESDQPVLVAVETIVTLVTLLVVGFATVYYVLATHGPGQIDGLATKLDAAYFSVTVLATVGFGDVTATGQLARGVATLHMLLNLVFFASAVRIIGWAVSRRGADGQRPRG